MEYYLKGLPSWNYYYPYRAAPTFTDLPETGVVYGEETGRMSKKIVGKVATIRAKQMTFDRETSIIVTGQLSGAVYVLRVQVAYDDQRT